DALPILLAAVPQVKATECGNQQLRIFWTVVTFCQRTMQTKQHPAQFCVLQCASWKARCAVDTYIPSYFGKRRIRQIERAISPPPAPPHPGGLKLRRIRDEEHLRADLYRLPAGL